MPVYYIDCNLVWATDPAGRYIINLPKGLDRSIGKKVAGLDEKLSRQSEKYINLLAGEEEQILKELGKIDSTAAADFLKTSRTAYDQARKKISEAATKADRLMEGEYLATLDSLQGALGFLKDAKNIVSKSKDIQTKLGNSLQGVQQLQGKFNEVQQVQQLLKDRQDQLKQLLSSYSNLPQNINKQFSKYQQQAYYYAEQVREYKALLNDPDKLMAKTLELLRKLPAFQKFMSKNSFLAMLFPTPANFGTAEALAGLQTRADVQAMLPTQLPVATNGENFTPETYLRDNLREAQQELSKLKDKLGNVGLSGNGSSEMAMPSYAPNTQKTKSFWKRIETAANFQSQRTTQYFPASTDMALTVGYKLNDKTVIGVGASGKIGWGKSWKQLRVTGEGLGFRAYADWKAPDLFKTNSRFMASLWFTAGAEMNYNKRIETLSVFKNYQTWNRSALAGLSKKYSLNSVLKKSKKVQGSVQLLYDFLHRQHTPPTPAFLWRVGWGL